MHLLVCSKALNIPFLVGCLISKILFKMDTQSICFMSANKIEQVISSNCNMMELQFKTITFTKI